MAPMAAVQALELQGDLAKAFSAIDFQSKLLDLKQKQFADREEFVASMRNVAMVAQKDVLRKHNFPESFAGVAEMMGALSSHFMTWENLSQEKATAKAKAWIVGMTPCRLMGWSWPEPSFSAKADNSSEGVCNAKPSSLQMASLTAGQAVELQDDLVNAFSSEAFQSKLLVLSQERHADRGQFAVAMRDTALVAQKVVLRKHNFPETVEGVKQMTALLAAHFVASEALSQQDATTKAKGLIVGMASSELAGWSWPEPVALPKADHMSESVCNAKPSSPKMASLTAGQAAELQEDLVNAFSSEGFQSKLLALSQECHADRGQFAAAMRATALVAQKVVFRKHNFPETVEGVKQMTAALAAHFVVSEALNQQDATTKAKGLIVGMASSDLAGWSWPEQVAVPKVDHISTGVCSAEPSPPQLATLTANQAAELQEDLVNAFSAEGFQSKLLSLSQESHVDRGQFAVAMREAAMVAQKVVLRKHNFPETVEGVKQMTAALAAHFVAAEALSQQEATTKAKGLIVGMASSELAGWSWPEFSVASAPDLLKVSVKGDDSDDAASTAAPGSSPSTLDSLPALDVSGESEEDI